MAFISGYVLEEAQEMMTLSAIAYAEEDSQNYDLVKQAIENALSNPASGLGGSVVLGGNFQLAWLGISSDFGNLMYIAKDLREPARFAVVVRGSAWDFLSDWEDDFNVLYQTGWPTANPPSSSIQVAQGAWDGLQILLNMTSETFNMSPPPIPTMINFFMNQFLFNNHVNNVDIFVTGHSLGGAMATVLGLWLADTFSTWVFPDQAMNLKSYTFAAPTVGNQDFANYYNSQTNNSQVGWQAYRSFNEQDMIPCAYQNIPGIINTGIPLTFELMAEVESLALTIEGTLIDYNVSYVQVGSDSDGTARGMPNNPPSSNCPPTCNNPASSWDPDLVCWVAYEHASDTYLCLLGAPPMGIPEQAIDMASFAALPLTKLKPKQP